MRRTWCNIRPKLILLVGVFGVELLEYRGASVVDSLEVELSTVVHGNSALHDGPEVVRMFTGLEQDAIQKLAEHVELLLVDAVVRGLIDSLA